jgi:hypothetical protein
MVKSLTEQAGACNSAIARAACKIMTPERETTKERGSKIIMESIK